MTAKASTAPVWQGATARKPIDLWGVGSGPRVRKRGEAARARRAAKRAAKAARMGLKAYLRSKAGTP